MCTYALQADGPQAPHEAADNTVVQAKTMKAIIQPAYGASDVLRLAVVTKPRVGNNDVLVRVRAASVCKGDVHILTGKPYIMRPIFGLFRPRSHGFGQDIAGRIEEVGKNVTSFRPGDDIYGKVPLGARGGFAEYVCAPAKNFALKPANLSYEQAAAVPDSALTALQALRDVGDLYPGQTVLINGASGGVGTFAVQIAKAIGATVTAVCSTRHLEMVRAIGADHVIDYTKDDFARIGRQYDVMLDLAGNRSLSDCQRVLKPTGIFVSCSGSPGGNWVGPIVWLLKVLLKGTFARQKMTPFIAKPNRDDLAILTTLIEAGKVMPVIERRYSLHQVAEALAHVMEGHAQGKTVIAM
jgi:NADPH:quinone reductase-like Zn-dependent oxidoreductase